MPGPAAHLEASGLRARAGSATAKLWLGNEAAAVLSPAKAHQLTARQAWEQAVASAVI